MVMEFIMRLKKTTSCKACFKENMDRIGRVYLPLQLLEQMNIGDEITVQLALNKNSFPPGGYAARFVHDKETERKVRFAEDVTEKGELGVIYVNKEVLELMGVLDEIAVRVTSLSETGGASLAR